MKRTAASVVEPLCSPIFCNTRPLQFPSPDSGHDGNRPIALRRPNRYGNPRHQRIVLGNNVVDSFKEWNIDRFAVWNMRNHILIGTFQVQDGLDVFQWRGGYIFAIDNLLGLQQGRLTILKTAEVVNLSNQYFLCQKIFSSKLNLYLSGNTIIP